MNKKEFFKDKHKKIDNVIQKLCYAVELSHRERYYDKEINNLRKLANELQKQVHELNAGRNIFLDNDKDQ